MQDNNVEEFERELEPLSQDKPRNGQDDPVISLPSGWNAVNQRPVHKNPTKGLSPSEHAANGKPQLREHLPIPKGARETAADDGIQRAFSGREVKRTKSRAAKPNLPPTDIKCEVPITNADNDRAIWEASTHKHHKKNAVAIKESPASSIAGSKSEQSENKRALDCQSTDERMDVDGRFEARPPHPESHIASRPMPDALNHLTRTEGRYFASAYVSTPPQSPHSQERDLAAGDPKPEKLLQSYETPMLTVTEGNQTPLDKSSGIEFVETFFGRESRLEKTELFMQSVRLRNLRFVVHCEEVLVKPARPNLVPVLQQSPLLEISSLIQPRECSTQPSPQPSREESSPTSSVEHDDTTKDEVSSSDCEGVSDEEVAETLEDGHPLLQEVPTLVRILLQEFGAWRTHQGYSSSRKAVKTNSSNSGQDSTRSNKRWRELDEGASDDDEHIGTRNAKRPNSSNDEDESPLLACPFYKHDEVRHQKCLKHILRRIKNVKEHLRRCHKQPYFCPLCGQIFGHKVELDSHLRARTCDAREFQEPEGITEDHERSFRLKVDKKLTLSEQWKSVWRIIFPTEEPPISPFIEGTLHEGLACFRKFRNEKGPTIISDYMRAYIESHNLAGSISNPERTLEALLETVAGRAMDAVIEAYYDNLSSTQEDDGMASIGNSGVATQVTGSLSDNQEPASRPNFIDDNGEGNAGIHTTILPTLNPSQIARESFGQDLNAPSALTSTTEILIWQGSYERDFGIDGFNNLFGISNDAGPTFLTQDTSA
jgi:hypothetical protein